MGCEAKLTNYMRINENLYQISVEEECTIPELKLCQCQWGENSEGIETEAESVASLASAQSGSRDVDEPTVEMTAQFRRSSELVPIVPLQSYMPFFGKFRRSYLDTHLRLFFGKGKTRVRCSNGHK